MSPEELLSKIRSVEENDRGSLLTISYSKLDLFENCKRRFKKQYFENKWASSRTLPLEIGNILHKGLEMKGQSLIKGEPVDYDNIINAVMNGCDEITDKNSSHLCGINEIKERYSRDWLASLEDTENKSYPEKVQTYINNVLPSRMEENPEWEVIAVEKSFEVVYDDRCIVHGFIDRVDQNVDSRDLKVVDYKSSKKVFTDNKIKTPLQMIIYDMGCLYLYGKLPAEHEYDFILLDEKQTTSDGVCSRGYLTRGIKKIDKLLDEIDEAKQLDSYPPSPTPLCYWCPYAPKYHSPNADDKWQGDCPYFCLWTPENKIFAVNQVFDPDKKDEPVRKLVF